MSDFYPIVQNFQFDGKFLRAEPYGFGHINDTYAAYFEKPNGDTYRYILQRINHKVFRNPPQLMKNIEQVTNHLRKKIITTGGDPDRETLNLILTTSGDIYFRDFNENYWRAYIFIEGAETYQVAASMQHVQNAGHAFGNFQRLLSDFPAAQLSETIPDFHNTPQRLTDFKAALDADTLNRAHLAKNEIEFVLNRESDMPVLIHHAADLTVRVTHNDTKFNNVMIDDQTGEGVCIIDLDTVMPGLSLYDFGDAIRSISNTAAEDERDLSTVNFSLTTFEYFTTGFLTATRGILTPKEVDLLPFSAKLMTLECGMRFLADYLEGDVYFKVHRAEHNLDRCRTQFKLVQEMEAQTEEMVQIIEKYN